MGTTLVDGIEWVRSQSLGKEAVSLGGIERGADDVFQSFGAGGGLFGEASIHAVNGEEHVDTVEGRVWVVPRQSVEGRRAELVRVRNLEGPHAPGRDERGERFAQDVRVGAKVGGTTLADLHLKLGQSGGNSSAENPLESDGREGKPFASASRASERAGHGAPMQVGVVRRASGFPDVPSPEARPGVTRAKRADVGEESRSDRLRPLVRWAHHGLCGLRVPADDSGARGQVRRAGQPIREFRDKGVDQAAVPGGKDGLGLPGTWSLQHGQEERHGAHPLKAAMGGPSMAHANFRLDDLGYPGGGLEAGQAGPSVMLVNADGRGTALEAFCHLDDSQSIC